MDHGLLHPNRVIYVRPVSFVPRTREHGSDENGHTYLNESVDGDGLSVLLLMAPLRIGPLPLRCASALIVD